MYWGGANPVVPVPVPVSAPPTAAPPTYPAASAHSSFSPLPLPVPVVAAAASPASAFALPVPRPTVAIAAAPSVSMTSLTSAPPPVSMPSFTAVAPPSLSVPVPVGAALPSQSSLSPHPSVTTATSAAWLRSSSLSPPPLASAPAATPLTVVLTPPAPVPIAAARPAVPKTVTFALPVERLETPPSVLAAAAASPAPVPLVSALRSQNSLSATPAALPVPVQPVAAAVARPVQHPIATPHVPALPLPAPAPSPPAPSLPNSSAPSDSRPAVPGVPAPVPVPVPAVAVAPHLPAPAAATPPAPVPVPVPVLPPTALPVPSLSVPAPAPAAAAPTPAALPLPLPSLPTALVPQPVAPAPALQLPVLRAAEEQPPTAVAEPPSFTVEEAPLDIPDYSAWLYPPLVRHATVGAAEATYPLAEQKLPFLLPAPSLLSWSEADVLALLPATLPPEYVIFGGARYSGAPLDLLRPPPIARVEVKKTEAYYSALEAQRLQFLADQLDVARTYLKIEARRLAEARPAAATPPPALLPAASSSDDVLVKPGEEEELGKATIWTTAYFGSPQQLHRVLSSKRFDGMLSCAGHVQYRRRQWGLKRAGETFVLGLGMKATALQFAAAAGKLDSVVLLLINGAKDNAAPRLKEVLTKEAMAMVASICAPPRARPSRLTRRPVAAAEAEEPSVESGAAASSFLNAQVVSLDEAAYPLVSSAPAFYPAPLY